MTEPTETLSPETLPAVRANTQLPDLPQRAPAPVASIIPDEHELQVYETIAKKAANSPFYNKLGGEAGIISMMLYARELGIPPMTAISGGLHNIQGRIEISARMMTSKIRAAGHQLKRMTPMEDLTVCKIYGKRWDTGEDMTASFTIEEARAAGLVKPDSNWVKWPADMLWARAITRLGRELFPDVIGTAYVEGEIEERFGSEVYDLPPSSPKRTGKQKLVTQPGAALPGVGEETPAEPTHKAEQAVIPPAEAKEPMQRKVFDQPVETPPTPGEPEGGEENGPPPLEEPTTDVKPAPAKEVVYALQVMRNWFRTAKKLTEQDMELVEQYIRDRFKVKQAEDIPLEQLEEFKSFSKNELLEMLGLKKKKE
jgi:hypothetical protein